MKIAIIGSGALGLYYGSLLARHTSQTGVSVHFLMRSDYLLAKENGIQIHSVDGDFNIKPVNVYREPAEIGKVDLVILGIKTTANDSYKKLIEPVFKSKRTAILCLQNGIGNEPRLGELFGDQHILGGVAFLCSNRIAPAVIDHIQHGSIAISPYSDSFIYSVAKIQEVFLQSSIQCNILPDYIDMRWRKQVWNVAFNGLCTVLNCSTKELLQSKENQALVRAIMSEVIDLGITLHQKIHKAMYDKQKGLLNDELIEDQIQKTLAMNDYLPSMLLDFRQNRPMETRSIIYSCLQMRDSCCPELLLPEITKLSARLRAIEAK